MLSRFRKGRDPSPAPGSEELRRRLLDDPLNPEPHLALAAALLDEGRPVQAHACARGAVALGATGSAALLERARTAAGWASPDEARAGLEHNRHLRLDTLARRLVELHGEDVHVLDVGGGDGELALFLPHARYVLAEPYVTGLRGEALPFADAHFDAVVSCHVLEHVPPAERGTFLDTLLRCARESVLLLGPFHVPGARQAELLELALAATGAAWAREHLECGLPELDEVRSWAASRELSCRVEPSGSQLLAMALVLGRHAASQGNREGLRALEAFLNAESPAALAHDDRPAAHLVELRRQNPGSSRSRA